MRDEEWFSHATAAVLFGIPVSRSLEASRSLHTTTKGYDLRPRVEGVISHRTMRPVTPVTHEGPRLSDPAETWCDLGAILSIDELIVAGDFVITGAEPFSGARPLAAVGELAEALDSRSRMRIRGVPNLRRAIREVRYGSLSPRETLTRLLLTREGLPEPTLNHRAYSPTGAFLGMVDLAYPELRIAIEYEGEHHRRKEQFRHDLARRARFEDAGWIVVTVTADDLRNDGHALVARVRNRIALRQAR